MSLPTHRRRDRYGISAAEAMHAMQRLAEAMGGPAPNRESFHLGTAKRAYVEDRLTIEELEASVAHVLQGGYLNAFGCIPLPPIELVGPNWLRAHSMGSET